MPNILCSNILRPLQKKGICWFMALIVVIFYSQRSRKEIIDKSPQWNNSVQDHSIQYLFDLILFKKYIIDNNRFKDNPRLEYTYFSDTIFIDLLSKLNKKDGKHFVINPQLHDIDSGFHPEMYIGRLYTLLGIDYKMFDFNPSLYHVAYSHFNKEYDDWRIINYIQHERQEATITITYNDAMPIIPLYKDNGSTPKILIIRLSNDFTQIKKFENNNIHYKDSLYPTICLMEEEKIYNGSTYNLDSIILQNYNSGAKHAHVIVDAHVIVGMTCKKKNTYIMDTLNIY